MYDLRVPRKHILASAATGPESVSQLCEPAISGITAVVSADSALQQQTCCSVLMFRSWPEPLLQVDRMASCQAAQRQQLPLTAALQEPCNSCAS